MHALAKKQDELAEHQGLFKLRPYNIDMNKKERLERSYRARNGTFLKAHRDKRVASSVAEAFPDGAGEPLQASSLPTDHPFTQIHAQETSVQTSRKQNFYDRTPLEMIPYLKDIQPTVPKSF